MELFTCQQERKNICIYRHAIIIHSIDIDYILYNYKMLYDFMTIRIQKIVKK